MKSMLLVVLSLLSGTPLIAQACKAGNLSIEEYPTDSHPKGLRMVSYNLSCNAANASVVISGLGNVPGQGRYTYLTEARSIVIKSVDPAVPQPLAEIPVQPNAVRAGGENADVPTVNDFSAFSSPGSASNADFVTNLIKVLEQRFGAFQTVASAGDLIYISTYRRLSNLPPNMEGEVAVMVVFSPHEKRFEFHVLSKESRSKSSTWIVAQSDQVKVGGQSYADSVFAQLSKGA